MSDLFELIHNSTRLEGLTKKGHEQVRVTGILEVPIGVKYISRSSFEDFREIEELILPEGLVCIDDDAFKGCNISKVVLPSTMEIIGLNAFEDNVIEELVLNEGLVEIKANAFEGNLIEEVKLPESLKYIECEVFKDNPVREIDIPENVREVGEDLVDTDEFIPTEKKSPWEEEVLLKHPTKSATVISENKILVTYSVNLEPSVISRKAPISNVERISENTLRINYK